LAASGPSEDLTLLGVDVGGTFTDAVVLRGGSLHAGKAPTTPADQSDGVIAAVAQALERARAEPSEVARFAHGMTVGTNALLEERGARTALVTTAGFEDVIEIARQSRPELYRLCRDRPPPLVPRELRIGVDERIAPEGVVTPLGGEAVERAVRRVAESGVESVAVCLLHSYLDPSHERRIADAISERCPNVHVSSSHEVVALFREYERTSTTVIDAYLSPLLGRYLGRLATRATAGGLPEPEVMQSNGGLAPGARAALHAAWTVLSGPAGGAVGAARIGELCGERDVISFDMGGTSCDVAVVDGGTIRETPQRMIGGRVLQLPMVDVHTVGAGGGSIGWADAGGALRVGPASAGADPGPACYGRGGTEPTVTDANLILGYLDPDAALAGGVRLDADAAERALSGLGATLGLTVDETAAGIVRVADQEMLRALRVVTVERGVDPRRYALVAFGGAGPMHAARLADELGIARILCPRAAGVLSALGLVASDPRRDVARSVLLAGAELNEDRLAAIVAGLAGEARAELEQARLEVTYDIRYRGQAFELPVRGGERPKPHELRATFERAHEERYGYSDAEAEIEVVNVRVAAVAPGPAVELPSATPSQPPARTSRRAVFDGGTLEATVLRGEPRAGEEVEGPAICALPEATLVIPPRWRAAVVPNGTFVLERLR
jgi:N-methylhydantoinase A